MAFRGGGTDYLINLNQFRIFRKNREFVILRKNLGIQDLLKKIWGISNFLEKKWGIRDFQENLGKL